MNWLKTLVYRTESAVTQVSRALNVIGIIGVATLMLLITSHVLGRYFFNRPITGTVDISQYVMIIAVFGSVAYCAVVRGHVSVDLLVSRFPHKAQAITDLITGLAGLALLSFMVWVSADKLMLSWARGEVSLTIGIPAWPFRTVLLIGIVMFALVLLIHIIRLVASLVKK